MLYVSQAFYDNIRKELLKKQAEEDRGKPFMPFSFRGMLEMRPDPMWGMDITVAKHLPTIKRTGKIIQKDRFAEYGPEDMDWAEPAGLAAWETEEVHCYEVDDYLLRVRFDVGPMRFMSRGFILNSV